MRSRHITIIVTGLLCGLLCLPASGIAGPQPTQTTSANPGQSQNARADQTSVTFDADQASVVTTGTFSYTVRLRPATTADSVSARFELFDQNDKSIYHRTKYWNFDTNGSKDTLVQRQPAPLDYNVADAAGYYSETFTKNISNFDLPDGSYRVSCLVRISTPQRISTQRLESRLFVYDPTVMRAGVLMVLRVGAPPLRRTDGLFASDPATGTARLRTEQLERLAQMALTQPQDRMVLAVSPLLLEELADIADGCHYIDENGDQVELGADSAPAHYVAKALSDLRSAMAGGHLEVAWQGYADPNVSMLMQYQLSADVAAQYTQGGAVIQNVLKKQPALITAPFGDQGVVKAQALLNALGIKQVLIPSYNKVSQSLETSTAVAAQEQIFDLRGKNDITPVTVGLPLNEQKASALIDRIETLQSCGWMSFQPSASVMHSEYDFSPTANPGVEPQSFEAPQQDSRPIIQARQAAHGLSIAVGKSDKNAREATRLSLIAENAFGPAPAVTAASPHAESYTVATMRVVKQVFSVLSLKIHPVTLAGSSGEVPVTVVNSSSTQMQVSLRFSSLRSGVTVKPAESPTLTVAKNNTLFSPNVTLRRTGVSDLRVRLMAGEYVICEDRVAISASYLDTIGIVAIVVIVGAGLIFYLWRHSRRAQKGEVRGD